jgi:hypothetical protein
MARQCSVTGWHGMRKQELIDALRKVQRQARRREKAKASSTSGSSKSTKKSSPRKSSSPKQSPRSLAKSGSDNKSGSDKAPSDSSSTVGAKAKRSGQTKAASGSSKRTSTRTKANATGKSTHSQSDANAKRTTGSGSTGSGSTRKRKSSSAATAEPPRKPVLSAEAKRKLRERQEILDRNKDLSANVLVGGVAAKGTVNDKRKSPHKDRAILIVRDSYWLQASWEVTRASVERARAALAEHWHSARPVLRLMSVVSDNVGAAEQPIRDISIHGGVNNWYIDVLDSPAKFRVVVGYASGKERFYAICRSNVVETPPPGSCDAIDGHWQDIAEDYERIYALSGGHQQSDHSDLRELFEDRLHRTMSPPDQLGLGKGSEMALRRDRDLPFEVDAELIVYGSTTPGASVSLGGEPVKLRPDGTFTVRLELPDRRQVLPVVATSRDGMRQRTTVVAVERNTKVMEPYDREDGDA